jgi:hypothetical protein
LDPETEANALRRVYWNHSIGWLRMHEFILTQKGDCFEAFIEHVKKLMDGRPKPRLHSNPKEQHQQHSKGKGFADQDGGNNQSISP